eukprot:4026450-Pleurochrysis_carterae.AAC.3
MCSAAAAAACMWPPRMRAASAAFADAALSGTRSHLRRSRLRRLDQVDLRVAAAAVTSACDTWLGGAGPRI